MEALTNFGVNFGKSYLNYESNVELLERDLRVLAGRAADIEDEVKIAEGSGKKKRKREVAIWFEDVKKLKDDFVSLRNKVKEKGLWKQPLSGEEVVKLQERVAALTEQSQHFSEPVLDAQESKGKPRLTSKLFGGKVQENLEKILQCFLTDNIRSIGIYGMGGVGKTTLAKHINNHLIEIPDFFVCWLTISQELSIRKLQDDIARHLCLSLLDCDDEEIRADILSRKLMQMDNFILILDDVWEGFCLKKLGNPSSAGCRLILTTRSLQVCHKMQCERVFEVQTLTANEAWELFKDGLGYQTILQPQVEEIAKAVAKRCAGLPLGIITMAGCMNGVEDLQEWRNALEQLKALSIGLDDMESKVFPVLQWSFSRLDKFQQRCFLCCSLYPEDYFIPRNDIICRFISLDLMDRRDTRRQEYDQGHAILNKLINVCLLEKVIDCHGVERVKIHDLIRDMALRITSGKISNDMPRFMVKSGLGLTVIPSEREWEQDLEVVSLMNNNISDISEYTCPPCPNLSILILEMNYLIRSIPDSFFAFMMQLKVLDLSHTMVKELPDCISDMVSLTALILHDCVELTFVPSLRKLKNLRELNLCNTAIESVPQGLEVLVNLKYLNTITRVGAELKQIQEGTLSRLCYLQCLRIPCAIEMKELEGMKQLEIFQGSLSDVDTLNNLIMYRSARGWFDYYDISVGAECGPFWAGVDETQLAHKKMTFKNCNLGNTRNGGHVSLLPQDIQELEVYHCYGMACCLTDTIPQLNSLNSLSDFSIRRQDKVKFLLRFSTLGDQVTHCCSLQAVVRLRITSLPELVGLINWDLGAFRDMPCGTFSWLRQLYIGSCSKIKKLLPLQLLQNLQNLEEIDVWGCSKLEEIVTNEEAERPHSDLTGTVPAVLPKLRKLYLFGLRKLRSICGGVLFCDSIEEIVIDCCPKLRRLPIFLPTMNGELCCPKALRRIIGSKKWWDSLEWDNPSAKNVLQSSFVRKSRQSC